MTGIAVEAEAEVVPLEDGRHCPLAVDRIEDYSAVEVAVGLHFQTYFRVILILSYVDNFTIDKIV